MSLSRLARAGVARRALLAAPLFALPRPAPAGTPMLRVGGTGSALGGIQMLGHALHAAGTGPGVELVPRLGTLGGLRGVASGALDLAVAARPPTPQEQAEGLQGWRYATTPLVFATHPDTPAEEVTLDQAIAFLGGTASAWPDGTRLRVTRRPDADSETQILAGLSGAMAQAVAALQRRPGLATAASDHDQAEALEIGRGTFGIIALSLVRTEARRIRVLRLDGRAPESPDWPMRKPLHVVTRLDPAPAARRFLDHLAGPVGVALLSAHGHAMQAAG